MGDFLLQYSIAIKMLYEGNAATVVSNNPYTLSILTEYVCTVELLFFFLDSFEVVIITKITMISWIKNTK